MYFELADTIRWRLGLPRLEQLLFERITVQVQLRGESAIAPGATLIFGDSHLQGLPMSDLGVAATNFAIGGETAERLAHRIGRYSSVLQARRIILLSGTNDLSAGTVPAVVGAWMAAVMRQVPSSTQILLLALPPSAPGAPLKTVRESLNIELSRRCAALPSCRFVALSSLRSADGTVRAGLLADDGVHLSPAGYRVLIATLADAIQREPLSIAPEAQ